MINSATGDVHACMVKAFIILYFLCLNRALKLKRAPNFSLDAYLKLRNKMW